MKILSIGNSFSQDAHKWLHKLGVANGVEVSIANLYIGGCSLETHWQNVTENNEFYDLEINGNEPERKISIKQALNMADWDIITVQQVSQFSGMPETYDPFIYDLVSFVRKECARAKIYFHQTWAYEIDSDHGGFVNYENDQRKMYDCIIKTSHQKAKEIGAELIPVGSVIQYVRENIGEFDYKNGGLSLCRDGFHLSLDYGRYLAAAVWFRTLTGKPVKTVEFENFDTEILNKINNIVNNM